MQAFDILLGHTLKHAASVDLSNADKVFGSSIWAVHRVDLHNQLLRLALGEAAVGSKSAVLRLGA